MLIAALLGVGLVAGCGGDDGPSAKEQFEKDYGEVNDDLLSLSEEVGTAVNTARGKSDAQLATQFASLGERTQEVRGDLDELDPPEEYQDLTERLSKAIDVVATDLTEIGEAADANDATAARAQAVELGRHSVEVRTARRELARRTGAKVTSGSE
jgi:hypothetical protein